MTLASALTDLNTLISDSTDITFSSSEKTRALTRAWNDSYVVNEVFDSTLTYSTGTYNYTLPATLTTIQDIYLSPLGDTTAYPDPIDNSLWELVNGIIQFRSQADNIIPHGYKLYVKGHYKLLTTDTISNTTMQEYVLALAGVETLKALAYKKANRFLTNDTSMGEIVTLRRELQQDVVDLRRRLRTQWESA